MSQYRYLKGAVKARQPRRFLPMSHGWRKKISILAIFVGLVLFGNATAPILSYELFTASLFQDPQLATPLISQGPEVLGVYSEPPDLTRIESWFPSAPLLKETPSKVAFYTLTVPKLNISDAAVKIGGEDLSKSLIHYAGTALPGRPGNAVILGHSVLPQFFDPRNYLAIFSTLPILRNGDEFFISYDGVQYRYVVEDMVEVAPTNFTILEQRFDDAFATLITCVPPGLKSRRLAVRGRLVNNTNSVKPSER